MSIRFPHLTLMVVLTLGSFTAYAPGYGQNITPHEHSPGVEPTPYDYFHPTRSGTFRVIVTPTDVWEQVTPASVAGITRSGLLPVLPAQGEPDPYSAQIAEGLGQRHALEVLFVGKTDSITSGLINWFRKHGASSVDKIQEPDLFKRSVELAEKEIPEPRCAVFTPFNPLAGHLAALEGGPAFPLRHEVSLPLPYLEYLERHRSGIQSIYLVDVAQRITESQAVYETYGHLTVPQSIEEEIKARGFRTERITGVWEEDVSVALARNLESIYGRALADGYYEHLPLGWIPSSSLTSEWTNVAALIPFALAKQWFLMEYWADIHLQGREDTVAAFSDQYVPDFFLGLRCLRPSAAHATLPTRREQVLCTFYTWLTSYLYRTGIRDFILCEANGPYGENAAPMYNFEQVPGMILCGQMPDLFYRGWSGGGGLSGIDYDGSMAARKSCAVILLALERALYPPMPRQDGLDPAWPPKEIGKWEEAPRAVCLTSDYEGWYANVFITPRLIEIGKRKGIKFTLRPQGDISFCLPDYLRRYYELGQGVIEFSNQGFLHEFNVLPYFSPYYHAEILADAVDRMNRFAGIQMNGFMPAGGFLTSTELFEPARALGLQYILCPQGSYVPQFDMLFDIQNRGEAPTTGMSAVSHFSQPLGNLAYSPTVEEDIEDNIAFLDAAFQKYDNLPYAPYTSWHFAHGFQMPDEAAFRVLEGVLDYLKEHYIDTGEMVSATLSDLATYFEEGTPMIRTPAVPEEPSPPPTPQEQEEGGCGSCSHLPAIRPGSPSVMGNFVAEVVLVSVLLWGFFSVRGLALFRSRKDGGE